MRRDPRAHLRDVLEAARNVQEAVAGLDRHGYDHDRVRQWAVERQFEIVGEALDRLRRDDPVLAERVPAMAEIIGFRNVLIHGYDIVDRGAVWTAITVEVPALIDTVAVLLGELAAAAGESHPSAG